MGLFKRVFHPNRVKREKQNQANDSKNQVINSGEQEKKIAKQKQEEAIKAIDKDCCAALEQINVWYKAEITNAKVSYEEAQVYFKNIADSLQNSLKEFTIKIENDFNLQKEQLLLNQTEDKENIEHCYKHIKNIADNSNKTYIQTKEHINSLWDSIKQTMLSNKCLTAYSNIKDPLTDRALKVKHYIFLTSFFKNLLKQNVIREHEFKLYAKFLYDLSMSVNDLKNNNNYIEINRKIIDILQQENSTNFRVAKNSYNADHELLNSKHLKEVNSSEALLYKIDSEITKIALKYEQELKKLTEEYEQKILKLNTNYNNHLKELEVQQGAYQSKHDSYLKELDKNKNNSINEVKEHEKAEKKKINDQYDAIIQNIEKTVNEQLKQIQTQLQESLRQLKKVRKLSIINVFTTIGAATAAYFSGGLLAGASQYIIESVQNSLMLTSIGSAANLIKGNNSVGINFSISLPMASESYVTKNKNKAQKNKLVTEETYLNLEKIHNKFKQQAQDIKNWESELENNLFFALDKQIYRPKTNYSNELTSYNLNDKFSKNFYCYAKLGPLQKNGCRIVNWNIKLNNQNNFYGIEIIKDKDILNFLKKLPSINEQAIGHDWNKPQQFIFNGKINKFTNENKQIRLNNSKHKASFLENVLDFFIPTANAKEIDFAQNKPIATKKKNNLFDILNLAIHGDIEAKLKMRQKMPMLATFFDAIDPNLEYKSKDNAALSEFKVYGRAAKNVRDGYVFLLTNPHEAVKDFYYLGTDIIELGMHYIFNTNYHQGSKLRNEARLNDFKTLYNSDHLTKKEAFLTLAMGIMLPTPLTKGLKNKVNTNISIPFKTKKLGTYGYHNTGKITRKSASSFIGGKYTSYMLKEDIIVYRVGSKDRPLGEYFSLDRPFSELQSRIDKAIRPIWPGGATSIIDTAYKIKIPKGTIIHIGEVAPQGNVFLGGTEQIFIQKPWLNKEVKVLETYKLNTESLWNNRAKVLKY